MRSRVLALSFAVAILAASAVALSPHHPAGRSQATGQSTTQNPDSTCGSCHQAIVDRYRHTPMARASGPALENFAPGEFTDALSGVHYRIFLRDGTPWMSFSREGTRDRDALSGEEQLLYFIGSGHRGRTYLYERDGLWFELPVNFYAQHGWDITPKQLHNPEHAR